VLEVLLGHITVLVMAQTAQTLVLIPLLQQAVVVVEITATLMEHFPLVVLVVGKVKAASKLKAQVMLVATRQAKATTAVKLMILPVPTALEVAAAQRRWAGTVHHPPVGLVEPERLTTSQGRA
tara:strand:- start:298 stop:666 length:369 start_codon:yes stop_codon:yes gene_type:complete